MAKLELAEETKAGIERVKEADLLIAVAAPVEAEQLRAAATEAMLGMGGPAGVLAAHRGCVSGAAARALARSKSELEPDGDP